MTCSEEPDAVTPHVRFCEGEIQQWMIYSTKAFQMLGWNPEVARGTLRALIARAGLTVDEFLEALES
ncbi:hypothetical protein D4R89_07900 [bacterium]|nr:MAG: hypothetical protein D4R89_07900 [bacterium]